MIFYPHIQREEQGHMLKLSSVNNITSYGYGTLLINVSRNTETYGSST
jgi:hypothetical protein